MKPYYEDDLVQLWHGDCREILPELGLSADLIVTDPPYGETSLEWDRWPEAWPSLAAKHSRSMWCFGSMRMFLDRRAEFADWRLSHDVVWEKNTTGMHPGDRFSRCHEFALHWYIGDWAGIHHTPPRVAAVKRVSGDVISRGEVGKGNVTGEMGAYRVVSDGLAYQRSVLKADSLRAGLHPTEKPQSILTPLIEFGCPPSGVVADLFAGSGSTLYAAKLSGRRGIGIEAREDFCETAARRLSQDALDFGGVA